MVAEDDHRVISLRLRLQVIICFVQPPIFYAGEGIPVECPELLFAPGPRVHRIFPDRSAIALPHDSRPQVTRARLCFCTALASASAAVLRPTNMRPVMCQPRAVACQSWCRTRPCYLMCLSNRGSLFFERGCFMNFCFFSAYFMIFYNCSATYIISSGVVRIIYHRMTQYVDIACLEHRCTYVSKRKFENVRFPAHAALRRRIHFRVKHV